MKKKYFPLYDFTFRKSSDLGKKKEIIDGPRVIKSIELNVPIKSTKLEIRDSLKKLYHFPQFKNFKLTKIRTLIQRGDRKLFFRNTYIKRNYKKVILTWYIDIKK